MYPWEDCLFYKEMRQRRFLRSSYPKPAVPFLSSKHDIWRIKSPSFYVTVEKHTAPVSFHILWIPGVCPADLETVLQTVEHGN